MDTASTISSKMNITTVTLTGEIVDPWAPSRGGAVRGGRYGHAPEAARDQGPGERGCGARRTRIEELENAVQYAGGGHRGGHAVRARLSEEVHKAELELLHQEAAAVREETGCAVYTLASESAERAADRVPRTDRAFLHHAARTSRTATAAPRPVSRASSASLPRGARQPRKGEKRDHRAAVTAFQEKQAAAEKGLAALATGWTWRAPWKRQSEIGEFGGQGPGVRGGHRGRRRRDPRVAHRLSSGSAEGAQPRRLRPRRPGSSPRTRRGTLDGTTSTLHRSGSRRLAPHEDRASQGQHLDRLPHELRCRSLAGSRSTWTRKGIGSARRLNQMGPINVDALQEYNELRELMTSVEQDIRLHRDEGDHRQALVETIELFTQSFNDIHEERGLYPPLRRGARSPA